MINIYCARENINKDAFMFDLIKGQLRHCGPRAAIQGDIPQRGVSPNDAAIQRIVLVVPEQSTLNTEQSAFHYIDAPGFIDLDIVSTSSLGRRVFSDVGGGKFTLINKYGKYMLFAKLLRQYNDELCVYKDLQRSPKIAEKLNDMISELKQFGISPHNLEEIAAERKPDSILTKKLKDVALIYQGYEESIGEQTVIDTADSLTRITEAIPKSQFVASSEVWIYGYDYMSPAMVEMLMAIAHTSPQLNVILTADQDDSFFELTNGLAENLATRAKERGIESTIMQVLDEKYVRNLPSDIALIEAKLFAQKKSGTFPEGVCPHSVQIVQAANVYAEAETAAVKISELLRDFDYKCEDILILCNDMQGSVPQIRRVFEEYGLPVFVDQRKAIEHDPAVEYILALPEIVHSGWKYEDIFRFLRTGLTGINVGEIEELENYVLKYEIRGAARWSKEFTFGFDPETAAEELISLNRTREVVYELISEFAKGYKKGMTCGERTENLMRFLNETAKLPDRIEEFVGELTENGEPEHAALAAASWKMTTDVTQQLTSVLADIKVTHEEYALMLRMGFEHVKMGILPANRDSIMIGTSQRTRSGNAKAVFVLGANDGVFPAYSQDEGLLSDEEKERLESSGNFIGRSDETKLMEEQISIYRNFAKPSELLYISYSTADSEGGDIRPAPIIANLRKTFPDLAPEKDIASMDNPLAAIQSASGAVSHMSSVILDASARQNPVPKIWQDVWLRLNKDDVTRARLTQIKKGLKFANRREYIGVTSIRRLLNSTKCGNAVDPASSAGTDSPSAPQSPFPHLMRDPLPTITTSPSALEKYSHCPFSWFISRGLRLTERERVGLTPMNIGNIYHNALMTYGRELTKSGAPNSPESLWSTITDAESKAKITSLTESEVAQALTDSDLLPGYSNYKMQRIKEVTAEVAWAVTEQIRAGHVSDMLFEAGFENGGIFPPINTYTDGDEQVEISGRIDRVDILDDKYALITDYKSGSDTFSEPDIKSGWQLQLMLYLAAASAKYKPAGVNYFKVFEPHINDPMGEQSDIETALAKELKGSGKVVDTSEVTDALGVKISKMEPTKFEELINQTNKTIKQLCKEMSSGAIDVNPKRKSGKNPQTACTYCTYKGICGYIK
jgi:ATP-dependent helicase/nuclease subunit B